MEKAMGDSNIHVEYMSMLFNCFNPRLVEFILRNMKIHLHFLSFL